MSEAERDAWIPLSAHKEAMAKLRAEVVAEKFKLQREHDEVVRHLRLCEITMTSDPKNLTEVLKLHITAYMFASRNRFDLARELAGRCGEEVYAVLARSQK